MDTIIARCGYRCDLCPALKDNVSGPEHQQWVSDGWYKYYGFRIPPGSICCDGCCADDSTHPNRIDTDCPVRPCVIEKGLESCAQCNEHICEKLRQRLVDGEEVLTKVEQPIAPEEFNAFVRAYDNRRRLGQIRSGLQSKGEAGETK